MPVYNHYYPDPQDLINTTASADRLALEGPSVPVTISPVSQVVQALQAAGLPVPAPVSGLALIDTGGTLCMVDEAAVLQLAIPPFGSASIQGPTGQAQHLTYALAMTFPGTSLPNLTFTDCIGGPLQASGIVALIGRNVLRDFIFIYNGPAGSVSLAY
jgi:hypothetical protein